MKGVIEKSPLFSQSGGIEVKKFSIIIILTILLITGVGYTANTGVVSVTATVISNSSCRFRSSSSSLNFGNLDPANPSDVTTSTTVTFRCSSSDKFVTFFISDDDGLYEAGQDANRMRHILTTTEFLPYSLTLSPTSGTIPKNTDETLTLTGTVRGADYQDALAGSFSDTVTLTIAP